MTTINTYTLVSNGNVVSKTAGAAITAAMPNDDNVNAPIASNNSDDTITVSILSHQLGEAERRAEARAGQKNKDFLEAITGEKYLASKTQRDLEVPNTNNPELLARARKATEFVNGSGDGPFNSLSRDQLNLIVQDEGGPFTLNERRAAWETLQSARPPASSSSTLLPQGGRDIMISRLFNNREPPVALAPASFHNITQNRNEFLNVDDRALIADMYVYAQSEGVDLSYVDRLVMALSTYRYYSDGQQLSGSSGYDTEGYLVTFDVKPQDTAIAERILNGSAIGSTRLDPGFLRFTLSPEHRAFDNLGGIPFLERMVNKFSDEGADQPSLGSEFATFSWAKNEDHVIRTVHKDIRLPASTALTEVVNGVRTLTKQAKDAGYSLDETTGDVRLLPRRLGNRTPQPTEQTLPMRRVGVRSLVDVIASSRGPLGIQPKWVSSLFQVWRNYRS